MESVFKEVQFYSLNLELFSSILTLQIKGFGKVKRK